MAGADEQVCMRWNTHPSDFLSKFNAWLESGVMLDCTLSAEGQFLKVHKIVLSVCSTYFETLFSQHYENYPIIVIKNVQFQELESLIEYMYKGTVDVSPERLELFLDAGQLLEITGLMEHCDIKDETPSSTPAEAPITAPVRNPFRQVAAAQGSATERQPESSLKRSRNDSASPTPKIRRHNQGRPLKIEDPDSFTDTSNSCDVPPLQSGSMSRVSGQETENSRVNNHDASAAEGVTGIKIEPLDSKYVIIGEFTRTEVITLSNDDDMNNSMDMLRADLSHDNSNQNFGQLPMSANQTVKVEDSVHEWTRSS